MIRSRRIAASHHSVFCGLDDDDSSNIHNLHDDLSPLFPSSVFLGVVHFADDGPTTIRSHSQQKHHNDNTHCDINENGIKIPSHPESQSSRIPPKTSTTSNKNSSSSLSILCILLLACSLISFNGCNAQDYGGGGGGLEEEENIESESCHYTTWSKWSNCRRKDCSGLGFQQRSRSVFDSDTSPCKKFDFPSLFQKRRCRARPCCVDPSKKIVELGETRAVSMDFLRAILMCTLNGKKQAKFRFVGCIDPQGRRSNNNGVWVTKEGFFEQCRIKQPCFWPDVSCIYTTTVACEDDYGNKVANGTEWLDSTTMFYKRCELQSIYYWDGDRTVVKSYVNDVSCVNDWGHKVGNWTEWLTKNKKYWKRCEIDWWDWRFYSAAAAIKVISCADDQGQKVLNNTHWYDAMGRKHKCIVENGITSVKGEEGELVGLEPEPEPEPTPEPPTTPSGFPNVTFVRVPPKFLSPFIVWTGQQIRNGYPQQQGGAGGGGYIDFGPSQWQKEVSQARRIGGWNDGILSPSGRVGRRRRVAASSQSYLPPPPSNNNPLLSPYATTNNGGTGIGFRGPMGTAYQQTNIPLHHQHQPAGGNWWK